MDDAIFHSKIDTSIQNLILGLKDGFLLEKEADMVGFLGLKIDHTTEG